MSSTTHDRETLGRARSREKFGSGLLAHVLHFVLCPAKPPFLRAKVTSTLKLYRNCGLKDMVFGENWLVGTFVSAEYFWRNSRCLHSRANEFTVVSPQLKVVSSVWYIFWWRVFSIEIKTIPWVPEAFHARFPVSSKFFLLRRSCLRPNNARLKTSGTQATKTKEKT